MSLAVSTPPTTNPARSQFADKKLGFFGVLRSEFLKFRTLTTNWVMTIVIAVVMIGFALIMGLSINSFMDMMKAGAEEMMGPGGNPSNAVDMNQLVDYAYRLGGMGLDMGNMLVGSVAVVFVGSEYATRSMQTTTTAVPRRSMVFFAKMLVLTIYTFVLGFVLAAISYWAGHMVLYQEIKDAATFETGVVWNWVAVAIYFVFMAWMGLGFGFLLRNNAGGIMMVVAIMLILPIIFTLMALSDWQWVTDLSKYLPQNLGTEMTAYTVADGSMKQAEAGGWFALWALIPALLGYLRFRFTDSK